MPRLPTWTARAPRPVTATAPAPRPEPAPLPLPESGRGVPPAFGKGWSGTTAYNGRVYGVESNPDLAEPRRWATVAREMVRTDAILAAAWEVTRSTLLAAQCVAEPGDEGDPRAVELADQFNAMMGWGGRSRTGLRRPFESYLGQMLRFVLVGFRYGEVGWHVTPDGRVIVRDAWIDRDPTAHCAFHTDPSTGELVAVEQHMPSGDESAVHRGAPLIPADELVVLVRDQEGADFLGTGVLRPCYIHWKARQSLIPLRGRCAELWTTPVPNVVLDYEGAVAAAMAIGRDEAGVRGEIAAQADAVRGSVDDFLRGDAGRFDTTAYVRVEEFGGKGDPRAITEIISDHTVEMLTAFLLQMLRLGVDNPARSVSETHASVKRRSVINTIQQAVETWSGHVIPRWIDYNFGPLPPELHPVVKVSGLEADPLLEVLDKLGVLADKGLLGAWGKGDVATLRRRLTLDPEVEPETAPAPTPAGGQTP